MALIVNAFRLTPKKVLRPVGMILVLSLALASLNCQTGALTNPPAERALGKEALAYGFEVVNVWPHDREAFTQGLVFRDGKLLESTGQEGKSSLRSVELETGKVLKKVDIPSPYFAEGITLLRGKIYQLTWQHQQGFIYDQWTFEKIGTFTYQGEGWGLTNDGESLIESDGSNRIKFIDPNDFHVRRTIAVLDQGTHVMEINELEFVRGEIYANLWHDDRIARIDPKTGRVSGWINLKGLLPSSEIRKEEAVLNGIAYDEINDRLFVTGKLWPKLFEIRLKQIR